MSKILLLAGTLLMISKALSFYNKSYNGYTFILPDNIEKDPSNSLPMKLSFADAQQWCKKTVAGSTLAAIYNKDIQRDVTQFIRSALEDNNWQLVIDLFTNIRLNGKYHVTDDWRWANGHPKAADLKVHDSTDESYPVYARVKNLGIYSTTANKTGRFICEYPDNPEQCSALLRERCFKKYYPPFTWYKARNYCSNREGDLVSFESLNDANINSLLRNLSLDSDIFYWIGLQKNEWRWENTDSPIKYSNWAINRPSNYSLHCLCITRSQWDWNECDCHKRHPFICILNDTRNSPTTKPLNDISAATDYVIIIASCGAVIFIIVVVIIIAAALIVNKRGDSDAPRTIKSSAFENVNEYSVTGATKDFPVYAEVQEPNETSSALNTTYAKVEMAENTYVEHPMNGIVYAELDLTSRP